MTNVFQKTLLALTISACAMQAYAQEEDVSHGAVSISNQNIGETLKVIGSIDTSAAGPGTFVAFDGSTISGSFLNTSQVAFTSSDSSSINGLTFAHGYNSATDFVGGGGSISGDLQNDGLLSLQQVGGGEGFEIGNLTVGGSVINSGDIVMTKGSAGFGEPEGMYLHGTHIDGDLVNTGKIQVFSDYGVGLIIDSHGATPFYLGGKLVNSGQIYADGLEATALDIEAPTSPLQIYNEGQLLSIGPDSKAVSLWDGTIDVLNNSGNIISFGAGSSAIVLQGVSFSTTLPTGQGGIVNTGTIQSDGDAIVVSSLGNANGVEINQESGTITSRSGSAIQGGGLATLNWFGGSIFGDLINMAGVNILGDAFYTGSLIDSNVRISNGSLNLSIGGVTTISGNLDVESQGSLAMTLSDATNNSVPYLTVNGTATFDQGSKIVLRAVQGDFNPSSVGQTYSLLSANSLVDNGLSVGSSSALLKVKTYTVDGNTVSALVALKSDDEVSGELGGGQSGNTPTPADSNQGGNTSNPGDTGQSGVVVPQTTIAILNNFKNNVLGKLGGEDRVFSAFANASTSSDLARLSKQLSPEVNRGGIDAAIVGQTQTSNAIYNRVNTVRGLSSGDVLSETGVWVQALNSNMDQDARGGVAGYSANSSGVAIGADGKPTENTTVGLAYSYLNANVTSDNGNKTQVQGNALSIYGAWTQGNWFTQGNLSYGRNDNDTKRYVADTLAKGSFDSDVLGLNVLGGYGFQVNDSLLVEPRVAARYSNVRLDGFTEHGSSAALRNGDQRFETGEVGAGLRVAGKSQLLGGLVEPEATLMAYHDLIGDRVSQTSAFAQGGPSFGVTGAKAARDSYEGSVGVSYSINALTLGASYNYEAKSGYNADTVMLKARYAF